MLSSSRRIHAQISGDRVEPGGELRLLLIGLGSLDHPKKHLLQKIFGLSRISDETQDEVEDRPAMTGEEQLERPHVSLLIPEHEALV